MKRRQPLPLPEHDYPVEEWRLVERRFSQRYLDRTETLFAVANGYLGLRGNFEEGRPVHRHGTLVNGFHETWPIVHAEEAYGLAKTGQTIVNVPDAKVIKLYVDDEPLVLSTAYLVSYERVLDMRAGTLERTLLWETPAGKEVEVYSRRLVSFRHRHLACFQFRVTVRNADAPVTISSQLVNRMDRGAPDDEAGQPEPRRNPAKDPARELDPRRSRQFDWRVLQTQFAEADDERLLYGFRTANSGMTLGCGVDHEFQTECDYERESGATEDVGKVTYIVDAKAGVPIELRKYASYHTSRSVPPRELADRAERVLDRAVAAGIDDAVDAQRDCLDAFWDRSDVRVDGDPWVQQAVRWNLFQLAQAALRAEGAGISSKGLTGDGYEGHYFWDVEIFVQPFLRYTEPRIAKNLLRFRHSMLPAARRRGSELNEAGALFPWRTINGEEASAYYQAGTAQYHINADIAHALKRYVDVTGETSLLDEIGAELLVETARLWVSLGFFQGSGFHLHAVTGPDEYTTVVDNNAFTNLMARGNLEYAAAVLDDLRERIPERFAALREDVGLGDGEVDDWRRAAAAMYVPYNEERGIHPQDEHFLRRKPWNFEATPPENYPLLLHYHPLVIYRHQVIKQADVVLAMFILGRVFDLEQKRRNFRYYDPITTSDSSLSPPVHSIVAAEIGDAERAMEHFRLSLYMDLADVAGNVDHGVHVACTGGVWMALVNGFGGMRDFDGRLTFDPALPSGWSRLSFPLQVRGCRLDVEVTHDGMTLRVDQGTLEVAVRGEPVKVAAGEPVSVSLR